MTEMNNSDIRSREFWMDIGIKLGLAAKFGEDFERFRSNDFAHLEKKVDKLTKYVWMGIGGLAVVQFLLNIAVKVIF